MYEHYVRRLRVARTLHTVTPLSDRLRSGSARPDSNRTQVSARRPNNNKDDPPTRRRRKRNPHTFRHRAGRRRTGDSTPLRARGHGHRSCYAPSCSAVTSTSASCTPSPTHRAWPLFSWFPRRMIGGPLTAHNWSAYGHISTDMIMWGDFSASHGSVKVIWDELRYSRRMRRLDRSSMLLLKVAPC